jgi:site-specific DNA-methyltransferase (adenine-specific)
VNAQETILFYTKGKNYVFNPDKIRIEYESKERIEHARKKGIIKNGKRWFPNPLGKLCPDVWEYSSYRHKNKVNGKVIKTKHPTPKPEDMIERMILASSDESTLVLDLFSGTGTTSVIAHRHNLQFIGCEYDEYFCSLIESRGIEIGRL